MASVSTNKLGSLMEQSVDEPTNGAPKLEAMVEVKFKVRQLAAFLKADDAAATTSSVSSNTITATTTETTTETTTNIVENNNSNSDGDGDGGGGGVDVDINIENSGFSGETLQETSQVHNVVVLQQLQHTVIPMKLEQFATVEPIEICHKVELDRLSSVKAEKSLENVISEGELSPSTVQPCSYECKDFPVCDWGVPQNFAVELPSDLKFKELVAEAARLENSLIQATPAKLKLLAFQEVERKCKQTNFKELEILEEPSTSSRFQLNLSLDGIYCDEKEFNFSPLSLKSQFSASSSDNFPFEYDTLEVVNSKNSPLCFKSQHNASSDEDFEFEREISTAVTSQVSSQTLKSEFRESKDENDFQLKQETLEVVNSQVEEIFQDVTKIEPIYLKTYEIDVNVQQQEQGIRINEGTAKDFQATQLSQTYSMEENMTDDSKMAALQQKCKSSKETLTTAESQEAFMNNVTRDLNFSHNNETKIEEIKIQLQEPKSFKGAFSAALDVTFTETKAQLRWTVENDIRQEDAKKSFSDADLKAEGLEKICASISSTKIQAELSLKQLPFQNANEVSLTVQKETERMKPQNGEQKSFQAVRIVNKESFNEPNKVKIQMQNVATTAEKCELKVSSRSSEKSLNQENAFAKANEEASSKDATASITNVSKTTGEQLTSIKTLLHFNAQVGSALEKEQPTTEFDQHPRVSTFFDLKILEDNTSQSDSDETDSEDLSDPELTLRASTIVKSESSIKDETANKSLEVEKENNKTLEETKKATIEKLKAVLDAPTQQKIATDSMVARFLEDFSPNKVDMNEQKVELLYVRKAQLNEKVKTKIEQEKEIDKDNEEEKEKNKTNDKEKVEEQEQEKAEDNEPIKSKFFIELSEKTTSSEDEEIEIDTESDDWDQELDPYIFNTEYIDSEEQELEDDSETETEDDDENDADNVNDDVDVDEKKFLNYSNKKETKIVVNAKLKDSTDANDENNFQHKSIIAGEKVVSVEDNNSINKNNDNTNNDNNNKKDINDKTLQFLSYSDKMENIEKFEFKVEEPELNVVEANKIATSRVQSKISSPRFRIVPNISSDESFVKKPPKIKPFIDDERPSCSRFYSLNTEKLCSSTWTSSQTRPLKIPAMTFEKQNGNYQKELQSVLRKIRLLSEIEELEQNCVYEESDTEQKLFMKNGEWFATDPSESDEKCSDEKSGDKQIKSMSDSGDSCRFMSANVNETPSDKRLWMLSELRKRFGLRTAMYDSTKKRPGMVIDSENWEEAYSETTIWNSHKKTYEKVRVLAKKGRFKFAIISETKRNRKVETSDEGEESDKSSSDDEDNDKTDGKALQRKHSTFEIRRANCERIDDGEVFFQPINGRGGGEHGENCNERRWALPPSRMYRFNRSFGRILKLRMKCPELETIVEEREPADSNNDDDDDDDDEDDYDVVVVEHDVEFSKNNNNNKNEQIDCNNVQVVKGKKAKQCEKDKAQYSKVGTVNDGTLKLEFTMENNAAIDIAGKIEAEKYWYYCFYDENSDEPLDEDYFGDLSDFE